ncbi:translation initiation factor IF-3 [Leptospira sp. GIMC2001]|uniref:translation initiation factor IF-3 n=1 Tax=Leptospira sp. GIMC2001 TaxID=1513297 RepID=UPI0023491695|nr:translation initiation factor IF-3 [Leptospira sp. GIMC2001]WCL48909.1 translation initiation factor IF-3 [Leptospira sp. GIMC2001]
MQKRSNNQRQNNDRFSNTRINEQIKGVDNVRLVTDEGPVIVSIEEALRRAREAELDLVEVSADQDVHVCKLIDYGKYRFEQLKKVKEAKKKQHVVTIKEIKIRPRIDSNDYEIKKKHAIEFLQKGDKVKVTLRFRGREMLHSDLGMKVVQRMVEDLAEVATAEKNPAQDGRTIVVVLNPKS